MFLDMFIGMPRIVKPLTALQVNKITQVGWTAVGGAPGLLLQVGQPAQPGGAIPRSWILRIRIAEKRQVVGLGSYPQVSLASAREEATKLTLDAKQGVNLSQRKKAQRSAVLAAASKNRTFRECALAYMDSHSTDYRNDKHRKQWAATLETYAYPLIGNMLVADIAMRDVLGVMNQPATGKNAGQTTLWTAKTTTAERTLGRIKTVLDYATVNEYRSGNNPAQWKGYLSTQLAKPSQINIKRHQPAVPYAQAGDFMAQLRKNGSISAKALEFLILTAVRSGSVREADWNEIDFDEKLWTIPPEHTKTNREHRVPLAPAAITLLRSMPKLAASTKVFPSPKGNALSDMALSQLMRGMRERGELTVEAVPHGFRSTFRDWAAEQTSFPDEIRKVASGHTVGDSVQQSYQRSDLLEKRRQLMEQWAKFLGMPSVKKGSKVTPIRKKA
jgi:integrase